MKTKNIIKRRDSEKRLFVRNGESQKYSDDLKYFNRRTE